MASARRSVLASVPAALALLALSGCEEPPTQVLPDATYPDAAIVFADAGPESDPCDSPMRVTASLDAPVEVTLDTSMLDTRPRDLGLSCGNVTAQRWARQSVIELTIPGTSPLALYMSTANSGTSAHFHTVLQVRSSCASPPTDTSRPTCFDSASGSELRAAGGLMVRGGETLFVYVTGYSDPPAIEMSEDEGPVRVTFELSPNTAPVLTSGRFILTPTNAVVFEATGTDAERAPTSMLFSIYGSGGGYDLTGDGAVTSYIIGFDRVIGDPPNFTGVVELSADTLISYVCSNPSYGCTEATITVVDHASLRSNTLRVPMTRGTLVGTGASCDATHLCETGLVCGGASGVCGTLVGAGASCDATHFCGEALICDGASHLCVEPAAIGEACDATHPCASELTCDGTSHLCVASAAIGEACDATHVCAAPLACDGASHLCVASVGSGEACDATHVCEPPLVCDGTSTTCVTAP